MTDIHLFEGDALEHYASWPTPTAIISDGPYGVSGYPGDPSSPDKIPAMYEPHVAAWAAAATSRTSLWFWNTEIGWAMTHPVLAAHGWLYRGCNVWDKGIGHIAGNCNGKTMRKFPVVTEVCVHYVREAEFRDAGGNQLSLQDWFRREWERTGLPFSKANDACGVKNAATRKYLTKDHLFYPPPPDVFAKLALYANQHGDPAGRPYFDLTAEEAENQSLAESKWEKLQAKFNFEYGATNVWSLPPNRGTERAKDGGKAIHMNQKPLVLMERIIQASTDPGDVVWDPFCGTAAGAVAAQRLGRSCYTAELNPAFYAFSKGRIEDARIFGV